MPRPSLAKERTELILAAFERCVGRKGLVGTALEDIAQEAGVKRSLIRHYLGNREDLTLALAQRVIDRYNAQLSSHGLTNESAASPESLVAQLFPEESQESMESIRVFESLIFAASEQETIRELINGYIENLCTGIAGELERLGAQNSAQCWSTAYALIALMFNHESLMSLRLPTKFNDATRQNALILIQNLISQ